MKLCIIPARGGSKRIPRKNIKNFLGKPIIAYSIEAALKSGCFDRIIVSTDDEEIAEVARKYGAETPFLRPEGLANDYAGTIPVIKQAVEWFEENDVAPQMVCCLYATAPFVTPEILKNAFQQLQDSQADYCFSVTPFASPIQRALKITRTNRLEMFHPENFNKRSQDLEESYHDAGQFYWGMPEAFKQKIPIFSESASPFVLPRYLVQDMDTPEDWIRAELMYKALNQTGWN
ncbi:pseudaminic acid cytidylyltransferase [Thiomicrorhabdus arctica]|uniref:pseudaminic acid cytidylyltransferase n=1 Tax=Thiomicrorhabdus arctica TaxID=131540 RepID=UPI000361C388|nr:pseudaminic acid cytidylyltransferase [Thiomicrorhabdus arctica]